MAWDSKVVAVNNYDSLPPSYDEVMKALRLNDELPLVHQGKSNLLKFLKTNEI